MPDKPEKVPSGSEPKEWATKALAGKEVSQYQGGKFKLPTLLGVQSWVRFCRQEFGEFPQLVGRYYSYLLPKQARGTPQILVDKTSPMTGRLRV